MAAAAPWGSRSAPLVPPASTKPALTKRRLALQRRGEPWRPGWHRHLTAGGKAEGLCPPLRPWESPGGQRAPGTPSSSAVVMAETGLMQAGDLLPNAAQALAHHAGACCGEAQLPRQEPEQQQDQPGRGRGQGPGGPQHRRRRGVGASTRSAVPLGRPPQPDGAPSLAGGRRAPLSEPIAVPLGAAGGGETASILTLCWLTQSPSMAAAAAKHGGRGFPPREGGRRKLQGEMRCSTGAWPGAAPHHSEG